MNKPLLLSLAAATILTSSLNAQSMYERIQSMELKMKQMTKSLKILILMKRTKMMKKQLKTVLLT